MAPKHETLKKEIASYIKKHLDALDEIDFITRGSRRAVVGAEHLLESDSMGGLTEDDVELLFAHGYGPQGNSSASSYRTLDSQRALTFQYLAPANALRMTKEESESAEKNNKKILLDYDRATDKKEDLRENPWADTPGFGIIAFLQRQLLSYINLTPFNGLNRFEVSDQGLMIFQPFRAVSTRTVRHQDLVDRNVILSINPPSYFDLALGLLGQFRWGRGIPSPWGQLVVDEPGSGRIVGTTVVLWPAEKQKTIENLLKQLAEADEPPFARMRPVPTQASLLMGYDIERWRADLTQWLDEPGTIPEEYIKLLYIPKPVEKKERKESTSKWPKRMGCVATVLFFFLAILVLPLWWIFRILWRGISRFLPKPLRFFSS